MQMFRARTYVIERMPPQMGGATVYGAFWPDPTGYAGFAERAILFKDTVEELKAMMARHYPGCVCAYEPEENRAAIAEAVAALKGGQ